jgi:ABC-type bacteriocin/lantibiotic exporter with double-glycine peptidase domain
MLIFKLLLIVLAVVAVMLFAFAALRYRSRRNRKVAPRSLRQQSFARLFIKPPFLP